MNSESTPSSSRCPAWLAHAFAAAGGCGVALGAFGAHALKEIRTPQQIETWKTATLYLLVHAAVGLALSLQARSAEKNSLSIPPTALILLLVGCAIFASSLYGLVLTQIGLLGAVAPIGGLLMIAGWLVLALRLRT